MPIEGQRESVTTTNKIHICTSSLYNVHVLLMRGAVDIFPLPFIN